MLIFIILYLLKMQLQIYIACCLKTLNEMQKKNKINVEKVTNHIVNWLQSYAENNKVNGFVIGISGGVDSAVTSTLCAKTGLKVLCVAMPIHQDAKQVNRAKEHIEQLKKRFSNVSAIEMDLTQTFDVFQNSLPKSDDLAKYNLALANSRARLRMTTLYYFAGAEGLLVAGTGNKVEDFGVGFYTKYGDGGVDLSPIADLMKSEVYEVGRYLEIPKSIQTAAPTDGLFGDDRTDEDQLGASYDEIEAAMLADEAGKTVENFTGRALDVFKIYKHRNQMNQHKMNSIPVCKVTRIENI
jgi:NAD+ synthase